jgi:hypothetical protein
MAGRVTKRGALETMVWPQLGPHASVVTSAKLPEHKGSSTYTCLVASWPAWVNKPVVEEAVDCLVRWFTPPTEAVGPALPLEMVRMREPTQTLPKGTKTGLPKRRSVFAALDKIAKKPDRT